MILFFLFSFKNNFHISIITHQSKKFDPRVQNLTTERIDHGFQLPNINNIIYMI